MKINTISILFIVSICSLHSDIFSQAAGAGPFSLTAPTGATNVQWHKDGTAINGETNATYDAATEGVYWVAYDDTDGCSIPAACISVVSLLDNTQQTTLNAPSGVSSFIWKKDDTEIPGATTSALLIDNQNAEIGTYVAEYNNGTCDISSEPIKLFMLEPTCNAGTTAPSLVLPTSQ